MNNFISAAQAAKILGISKVALINHIKSKKISATKVGNSYIIDSDELPMISKKEVSDNQKLEIEKAVDKTILEYSETLRLLKDT